VGGLELRLATAVQRGAERRRETLHAAVRALQAMSPLATLTRGYAVLTDAETAGALRTVTSITETHVGQALSARLHDGALEVRVTGITANHGLPELPVLDER
jgi:exodeoxyribonuclease VII large subunit